MYSDLSWCFQDIKVPFKMNGGDRVDDTPVHKALREALANCLVNADFYGVRGVVVKKEVGKLVFENLGYIRTGKAQMRMGGISDPRNKTLLKMFNLINIGERSGSGVPNIFNTWKDEGWVEPVIEEQFDPDRTILTLEFKKQATENKRQKTSDRKQATENKQRKTSDKSKRQTTCSKNSCEYEKNHAIFVRKRICKNKRYSASYRFKFCQNPNDLI